LVAGRLAGLLRTFGIAENRRIKLVLGSLSDGPGPEGRCRGSDTTGEVHGRRWELPLVLRRTFGVMARRMVELLLVFRRRLLAIRLVRNLVE
jgi:hypothetical protein